MLRILMVGLILTITTTITGCAHYTTVREHKDLQEQAKHINSVVVLPPEVSIEKIAFTGDNEKEIEKEAEFSAQLQTSAKAAIEAKGLKAIDFDFANELTNNQNLAFAITQCKESLKKSNEKLYKTQVSDKDKAKFSENVGAAANVIAEATGAQSMLIVNYKGFEKTAGMKAKDVAAGILLAVLLGGNQAQIAAPEGAYIEAALIATDSGDILWTNRNGGQQLNTGIAKILFDGLPSISFHSVSEKTTAETQPTKGNTELAAEVKN